jgi:rhamnosyltransferase
VPERVSVVIPVLNGGETLGEVLEALFSQRAPFEVEVVIVDSGSSDDSVELAKRYPLKLVQIQPWEFDHGTTRNLGIQNTRGEIVVLITQDATPASDEFLAKIVSPFADAHVAGVYGQQIPRPDCDVVTARNLRGWLTGREHEARAALGDLDLDALHPMERYKLCVFDNVCSAVRRSLWEELPFGATPFGEDIAWGKAAITRGWTIVYAPEAAVIHSHRRPVAEEYGRTRICHMILNQLFGLETLPRLRTVVHAWAHNFRTDIPYVWRNAPAGLETLRQLVRSAGLSVVGPVAQYQGIRDARREKKQP